MRPEILFCAPEGVDRDYLASLFAEEKIALFGAYLEKYRDALNIPDVECAYWVNPRSTDTFRLDEVPETVHEQVLTQPGNEGRATEICLNFDKAIRVAAMARKLEEA